MFNFNSLLGVVSPEEAKAADFAAGFQDGVIMAKRLVELIAAESADKSPAFIDGLFMALQEEL